MFVFYGVSHIHYPGAVLGPIQYHRFSRLTVERKGELNQFFDIVSFIASAIAHNKPRFNMVPGKFINACRTSFFTNNTIRRHIMQPDESPCSGLPDAIFFSNITQAPYMMYVHER